MARSSRQTSGLQRSREKKFCFRTQFKDFTKTAEIIVGPNSTRFIVHKDLLCSQSPYFAAALDGHFVEAASQRIELPDVQPRLFEHLVLWLYAHRLEPADFFFKDEKPTYYALLDLYALADRLCVEAMRNAIVDRVAELAERTNSVPTPSDTHILYGEVGKDDDDDDDDDDNDDDDDESHGQSHSHGHGISIDIGIGIRESAPLRRLVLDLFAFKKTDNLVASHPDEWHPTFLRELVCKLKRPGPAAVRRHDVRAWRPSGWPATKACELCRQVLKPMASANMCVGCEKAFCAPCLARGGEAVGALDWSVAERECKPWLREMCAYHEHVDTEPCRGKVN